eukprot:scaffold6431_cov139-Skeletonema_menzelii.AAC.3
MRWKDVDASFAERSRREDKMSVVVFITKASILSQIVAVIIGGIDLDQAKDQAKGNPRTRPTLDPLPALYSKSHKPSTIKI